MTQFQDQALRESFHIGVYEIKGILKASRFAITYRGWNHHLNVPVVLKEYFPADFAVRREEGHVVAPKSKRDRTIYESGLASFVRQAEILARIQQSSIVGVHNVTQINGTAYLIMDYEDAAPLSELSGPPTLLTGSDLRTILRSLLAGLDQVHAHGTVHDDIHPSNILVRADGQPVLIGFAAARLAIAERSDKLAEKLRDGYAAPERYDPGSGAGPESDLYALGATMYRCITGKEPAPAPQRVSALSKSKPDPLPPLLGSGIEVDDEDLLKTIDWMLRPQLKDRPASGADVLAALNAGDETVQPMGTETEPDDRNHLEKPAEAPTRTALWTGAVVATAALLAAGLWTLTQGEQEAGTQASKTNGGTTPASRVLDADTVPSDHPQGSLAEAAAPVKTEPVPATTAPDEPERIEGPAETKTMPRTAETVATGQPTAQPPSNSGQPATGIAGPGPQPTPGVAAADQAKRTIEAAQPPSDRLAAAPPEAHGTKTGAAAGDGTIQSHLAAAEKAIAAFRLTTPEGNNAYGHYQAVLAVDPGNADARSGMKRIVDLYVRLIEKAVAERRLRRAATYLARAEAVSPDTPSLRRLRTVLHEAGR